MNRRELFIRAAPLAALPFVKLPYKGQQLDAVEVGTSPRKFLIFVDCRAVDVEGLAADIPGWPNIDALFIPMRLRQGQTVQDALQIVEQFET